MQLHVTVSG